MGAGRSGAGAVKPTDHSRHLVLMRMHPAAGQKSHDMRASAAFGEPGAKAGQFRMGGQRAVLHRGIDPGQVLHDDPARADIHVPDFGIADLPVGKSDIAPRGGQPRMRPGCEQRVDIRGAASATALCSRPCERPQPSMMPG